MATGDVPSVMALPTLLDDLVARGGHWLMRSRLRDALKRSLPTAAVMMLVIGLLTLALVLAHALWGTPKPSLIGVSFLMFLTPALVVAARILAVLREHPSRDEALAIYDSRLDLKDRLRTADAFLHRRESGSSPFVEAAVEDALPAARRASERELFWAWGEWPRAGRIAATAGAALALLLASFFLPSLGNVDVASEDAGSVAEGPGDPLRPAAVDKDREERLKEREERPRTGLPRAQRLRAPEGEPPGLTAPLATERRPAEDDKAKDSEGMTEGGQHSDAKSSGRSDRSQGAPGNQSPASKPMEPKPRPKKAKPPTPPGTPKARTDKKVKDRSGATNGRGSSSGSSRNPASTDWSSKDRVEETDDQELSQEEEVDDEETESEARGGLQPSLRDRRPPVNRDLSIGFGNRSNPGANGRGGPGQRKKSRGVASLVLGVPVPDHVKGQVNPGRVKITQERIRPKAERSEPLPAEERGLRQDPYGTVPRRVLEPAMKPLVRDYFQRAPAKPEGLEREEDSGLGGKPLF